MVVSGFYENVPLHLYEHRELAADEKQKTTERLDEILTQKKLRTTSVGSPPSAVRDIPSNRINSQVRLP